MLLEYIANMFSYQYKVKKTEFHNTFIERTDV